MTDPVTVSGLVAAHRCPLRYWHELQQAPRESARYAIAKQIAAHLGPDLDAGRLPGTPSTVVDLVNRTITRPGAGVEDAVAFFRNR